MNDALTKKIKSLKPGKGFNATPVERVRILQLAQKMVASGEIKFDVVTKSDRKGGFKVRAI